MKYLFEHADHGYGPCIRCLILLVATVGKVEANLGGRAILSFGPELTSAKSSSDPVIYDTFVKLSLAYQINPWFSMGMETKYNFVLDDFNDFRRYAEA